MNTSSDSKKPTGLAIFRAGTHVATDGKPYTFTSQDVAEIAASYNPALSEAPLVVGHPTIDGPAYGWAQSLSVSNDTLYAVPHQVEPQFAELVNDGRLKKISASIYLPDSPGNPTPGKHYLRHIGFLGAQPPAVKGLPTPQFAEGDGAVEFSSPLASVGYSLVDIFSRLRDWLIERDGAEQADRVIPNWQIRTLGELTQREDTAELRHALSSFAAAADETHTEIEMSQSNQAQFAEREQQLNEQATQLQQREAAIAEREKAALRQEASDFAEGLVTQGKLLPRQKAAVVELVLALPAGTSLNFAEGDQDVSKPAATVLRELLSELPVQVNFAEKSAHADQPGAVAFAAPAGVLIDGDRAQLHAQAKQYAAANGVSFLQAVRALGG